MSALPCILSPNSGIQAEVGSGFSLICNCTWSGPKSWLHCAGCWWGWRLVLLGNSVHFTFFRHWIKCDLRGFLMYSAYTLDYLQGSTAQTYLHMLMMIHRFSIFSVSLPLNAKSQFWDPGCSSVRFLKKFCNLCSCLLPYDVLLFAFLSQCCRRCVVQGSSVERLVEAEEYALTVYIHYSTPTVLYCYWTKPPHSTTYPLI